MSQPKDRYCAVCGKRVPLERVVKLDAITCSDNCRDKNTRKLGWILEQSFKP